MKTPNWKESQLIELAKEMIKKDIPSIIEFAKDVCNRNKIRKE